METRWWTLRTSFHEHDTALSNRNKCELEDRECVEQIVFDNIFETQSEPLSFGEM